MLTNDAVDTFIRYCEARNLSERTVEYYQQRLSRWLSDTGNVPIESITPQLLREHLRHVAVTTSPATANHGVTAIKALYSFLSSEELVEQNPTTTIQKLKVKKTVIETFSPEQVKDLLATCKRDWCGVRDRAILLTFLDCGLRVSELINLKLSDVNWSNSTVKVMGKGNKERFVPFGLGVKSALTSYTARRGELATDMLFVSQYGEPLIRRVVALMVSRRCARAGITGVRCSPHTLRHTMAVSYLRSGGDVFSLQRLLGHASLEMTKRYCESLSDADVAAKHRQYSPVDTMGIKTQRAGRKRLK